MESEENKKKNILLIIIILVLSILVIMLGYYFISHEFFNNNDKKESNKNSEKSSNNVDNESQLIKYEFDSANIINKDTSYVYTLGEKVENGSTFTYEKKNNGYSFCSNGTCEELTGEFTTIIGNMMYKGGQGMGDNYYFLISKTGDLYFANEYDFGKVKVEQVTEIKNVVKLYTISLTSERITSPDGSTIVAQTKDGKLYDIYTFVK